MYAPYKGAHVITTYPDPPAVQPHNTRWLSPAQRRLAQVRLAEDAGEADEDADSDSYVLPHPFGLMDS